MDLTPTQIAQNEHDEATSAKRVLVVGSGSGGSAGQVQGTAADGAAAVGNPVQIGGVDGSGNVQAIEVGTGGQVVTQGDIVELTGLSAGSLNADLVSSTDVSNTPYVSLSILSNAYSGTLSFQASNDNFATVTHSVPLNRIDTVASTAATNTTATSVAFGGYVPFRYLRVRMTSYSSGTAQAVLQLRSYPVPTQGMATSAVQSGAWTVGANSATSSAVPANAFYLGMADASSNLIGLRSTANLADAATGSGNLAVGGYLYNGSTYDKQRSVVNANNSVGTGITAVGLTAQLDDTAPTSITENSFGNLRMSPNRSLMVENRYTLGRATADAQIKASAGFVHTITIAPITATPTAGLLTVYDSTTETGTAVYAEWVFATTPGHTVQINADVTNGIYVGFDATLANVQVTVAYR